MAEATALDWTSLRAAEVGWNKVLWVSDAMEVVKEVNWNLTPWNWDTFYLMLIIKERFSNFNWHLVWEARETNQVADAVTKLSLRTGQIFGINAFDFDGVPSSIVALC